MARRLFGARSDELVFRVGTGVFAVVLIAIVAAIGVELYRQSVLSIHEFGWRFWQTDTWDPVSGDFGARPFIWGTLYSSVLALLISTPIALGIAVFISELAPSRLQRPLVFLTELLAAIPSIVYGLWGVFVLVPLVRQLQVATPEWMRSIPLFTGPPLGVGMLSAALILAIMIIPFSSSVAREVLRAVPQAQREGAYALGATRWEAIRMALFYARTGIIGAVMLGFGRALGETMAVTMVIGNNPQITWSLYAPQYTMAAVLANEFTEAADDLYLHALIEIGLVLFIITLIINAISRLFIWSMGRQRKPRLIPDSAGSCEGDGVTMRNRLRNALSHVIVGLCALAVLVALVPLAFVLFYVVTQGVTSLSLSFFTEMPKPVGEPGGGMANAIVGSMIVVGIGALFAIPIGIISGIYASEYAGSRMASTVRFAADTLNGVPSIVIGVFVYGIAVLPFRQFSAIAGGVALGIMMIPLIMRTTEELLLLVPGSLKEGALALGATRARAVFTVVLPAALPGIMTGILLALARIAGETAPLLFTAFNNRFFSTDVGQPIATLTVQVFTYAISPYKDWHRQAWAGALVLVGIVVACSLLARIATARMERLQRGS